MTEGELDIVSASTWFADMQPANQETLEEFEAHILQGARNAAAWARVGPPEAFRFFEDEPEMRDRLRVAFEEPGAIEARRRSLDARRRAHLKGLAAAQADAALRVDDLSVSASCSSGQPLATFMGRLLDHRETPEPPATTVARKARRETGAALLAALEEGRSLSAVFTAVGRLRQCRFPPHRAAGEIHALLRKGGASRTQAEEKLGLIVAHAAEAGEILWLEKFGRALDDLAAGETLTFPNERGLFDWHPVCTALAACAAFGEKPTPRRIFDLSADGEGDFSNFGKFLRAHGLLLARPKRRSALPPPP